MTMEELFQNNGYRTDLVGPEERYVSTDERGRSVIGPRRHGHRPRRGWWRNKHTKQTKKAGTAVHDDTTIVIIDRKGVEVAQQEPGLKGWAAHQKKVWLSRFYDAGWHKAVQHTAVDVLLWAAGLSMAAVMLKGAWWIVTL